MRVELASARGLLGGFLISAAVRLLADASATAAWSAAGAGTRLRICLAAAELLGAGLFAFEVSVLPGSALLVASFIAAAVVHIHLDEIPWRLAAYAVAALLLLNCTLRARRSFAVA